MERRSPIGLCLLMQNILILYNITNLTEQNIESSPVSIPFSKFAECTGHVFSALAVEITLTTRTSWNARAKCDEHIMWLSTPNKVINSNLKQKTQTQDISVQYNKFDLTNLLGDKNKFAEYAAVLFDLNVRLYVPLPEETIEDTKSRFNLRRILSNFMNSSNVRDKNVSRRAIFTMNVLN